MKIYLLDLGSLVIDRSDVLWHIDVGTPVRFPVFGVYIDHPEGKFIFDTGYDLDHVNKVLPFELPEQTTDQTLPAQLAKIGVDPGQIDYVINSHFHFDHVGGNKYLTNATLLTSKHELRSSLVPEPFERLGYSDSLVLHPRPDQGRVPRGRRGDRQGVDPVRDTGPHRRPLLAHGGAGGPAADRSSAATRCTPSRRWSG